MVVEPADMAALAVGPLPGRAEGEAPPLAPVAQVDRLLGRREDQAAGLQHGAQLLVASDIASRYFEVRGAERRLLLLQQGVTVARRLHQYAQGRFKAGQTTASEVDRAALQVDYTESQIEPLKALRVIVNAPEQKIAADVTFTGRNEPIEEPRFIHELTRRIITRFTSSVKFRSLGSTSTLVSPNGALPTLSEPSVSCGSWTSRAVRRCCCSAAADRSAPRRARRYRPR